MARTLDANDDVQIAMTTIRLVAERGADRVSVADVARELGVAPAALIQRCPSEAALWRIVAAVIVRQMAHSWEMACALERRPADRLRALLAAQIRLVTTTPALRDILFSRRLQQSQIGLRREIAGARRQFQSILASTLRDGVAAGDFQPELDAESAAQAILDILQGMVLSWSLAFITDLSADNVWSRMDGLLRRRIHDAPSIAAATESA